MGIFSKPAESLCETVFCESALTIDRDASEIRGVKLIGLESQNGRTYSAEALKKAMPLYEGAKVNVNHPEKGPASPRDYRDRLGSIHGVQFREGASPGLYGTLRFNPKHPIAEQLLWDAENNPGVVGFSHNAEGRSTRRGGRSIVEEISKVRSVDLVADPATTLSLREGVETMTVAELLQEQAQSDSPLLPLLEMAAMNPAAADAPVPPMPGQPEGQVNGVREGLLAAINALFSDPSISEAELLDLLASKTKKGDDMPDPEKKPAEEPPVEKKPMAEQIAEAVTAATQPLVEQIGRQQKQLDARAVLEAKGAQPTAQLIEELVACDDRAAMEKLVEDWTPAKLGLPKPAVRGFQPKPVTEYPSDRKAFVSALKRRS